MAHESAIQNSSSSHTSPGLVSYVKVVRRPSRSAAARSTGWRNDTHTPACVSYRIGDAVFVGDTLFMPDYGTARADFPGGDASALYHSIRRLLELPPQTRRLLNLIRAMVTERAEREHIRAR